MKVKQLIKLLEKVDGDSTVVVDDWWEECGGYCNIRNDLYPLVLDEESNIEV